MFVIILIAVKAVWTKLSAATTPNLSRATNQAALLMRLT